MTYEYAERIIIAIREKIKGKQQVDIETVSQLLEIIDELFPKYIARRYGLDQHYLNPKITNRDEREF